MGGAIAKTFANLLRRCHECNFPLGQRDLFCPRCGAKQRREKLAGTAGAAGTAWYICQSSYLFAKTGLDPREIHLAAR
jgi:predicted amidophosphoribosyltransferase